IATPDKPIAEAQRVKTEPILAGRMIETTMTDEEKGTSDYSLAWFDAGTKQYRQWFFSGAGDAFELTGTWNEAAQIMTWISPDKCLEGRWVLKGDVTREFQHLVKATDGKVLNSATGVSRRATSGWVQLFNGTNLDGWKTHPMQPGNWRVEDGALVGSGPGKVSHLFSERDDFSDFHLRADVKINFRGKQGVYFGNSGIYFRAPFAVDGGLARKYPTGYEAQIFVGEETPLAKGKERNRTGSLYGLKPFEKIIPGADAGAWFTLEVIARGDRISIKVNGVTTVDEFQDGTFQRGHLALQQAGEETIVQFKKIEIKELPPSQPTDMRTDEEQLQGTWSVVSGEYQGKPLAVAKLKEVEWVTFSGDRMMSKWLDKIWHGFYRLDTAIQPKEIDLVVERSKIEARAIYQVNGNRLVLALSGPDKLRPPSFTSGPNDTFIVVTYHRDSGTARPAPNCALRFDGKSGHVAIPTLKRDDATGPVTIEAWARADKAADTSRMVFTLGGKNAPCMLSQNGNVWAGMDHHTAPRVFGSRPVALGERAHLALVIDAQELRFYVDGKLAGRMPRTPMEESNSSAEHAWIGATQRLKLLPMFQHFDGLIGPVRVSKKARYEEDFTPARRFELDADTLALYHFDEGKGDVLKDSSGNGHHGTIVDASWVNWDRTAIQPSATAWIQLFNKKDLAGWKVTPGHAQVWSVEEGVLVGKAPTLRDGYSFLGAERQDFGDFHLRAEVRIGNKGNSGIYFRTTSTPTLPIGYEAQIRIDGSVFDYTGSLGLNPSITDKWQHLAPVLEPPHEPDRWFVLEIIAQGDRLETRVDGKTVATYKGATRRSGGIFFEANATMPQVEFRTIEIKEMPASQTPLAPVAPAVKQQSKAGKRKPWNDAVTSASLRCLCQVGTHEAIRHVPAF
ncbi:MAG: DUF1080 domain-containing protein, partial [Gemmataceae bacterium]|nr:DUF1080 domain-containing protein [Gemmataceae bacterium]